MDRFRILKGLPPKPLKWDNCPKFVIDDDLVAIIVPSHKATKETADILYSQVPKPYAVFVSDTLEPLELIHLAERTQEEGTYQMAMQTLRIQEDHRWSSSDKERLQSLNFNFLKNFMGIGFQIWADNVIGSLWSNSIRIKKLSVHRILRFIDKGESLLEKHHRAVYCLNNRLIPELVGDPLMGFSIRIPDTTIISLTYENNNSLFLGNVRG